MEVQYGTLTDWETAEPVEIARVKMVCPHCHYPVVLMYNRKDKSVIDNEVKQLEYRVRYLEGELRRQHGKNLTLMRAIDKLAT